MVLKFITCSGADEHTNIDDLLALAKEYPLMEIGIQVSNEKVTKNPPRFDWLMALHEKVVKQHLTPNIALHICGEWVQQFANREMLPEADYFMSLADGHRGFFIKRLQVDLLIGNNYLVNFGRFCQAMTDRASRHIVLPYNDSNADFIHRLYSKDIMFDCLFNDFQNGKALPQKYEPPVFKNRLQGYSGGFSAENVAAELQKLSKILSSKRKIYIDAENCLKDDRGYLDLQKCKAYIQNALSAVK